MKSRVVLWIYYTRSTKKEISQYKLFNNLIIVTVFILGVAKLLIFIIIKRIVYLALREKVWLWYYEECITVSLLTKSKLFRRTCKLINSKIKNVMCLEKKKSKKFLNSHRNMAILQHLVNSKKSFRPLLKVLSDLESRDTKRI